MSAGEIADVDVVADAGTVGRVVVGAENGDVFALAASDLQDQGDEVRFRAMIFALLRSGAGGVEIAEAGIAQFVDLVEPGKHLLYEELRFAVGVGGMERVGFLDRRAVGRAVKSGGGGEDETWNFVFG